MQDTKYELIDQFADSPIRRTGVYPVYNVIVNERNNQSYLILYLKFILCFFFTKY